MDTRTVDQLVALNRQFYQSCAHSFSQTRQRVQPGVRRVLDDYLPPLTILNILDVGCGNADILPALADTDFRGEYTGVDFSTNLLQENNFLSDFFTTRFFERDLTRPDWSLGISASSFDHIFCFAALHHIPGEEIRISLLRQIRALLKPGGCFAFSVWQFQRSIRLARRIQPWELTDVDPSQLDQGDFLLDWRGADQDCPALRYVHVYSDEELSRLASLSGFTCREKFTSDGNEGNLSDYQIWFV